MSDQNTYKAGDWNAICDVCGWKYKASELLDRWDGAKVCKWDWEPRHPQDFLRAIPDDQSVPWTRPEPTDTFVQDAACNIVTMQAVPGVGIAGCMVPGFDVEIADDQENNGIPQGTFDNAL